MTFHGGPSSNYEDTGCEFAPSCLNCPFPGCIEDKLTRRRRFQIKVMICQGKSLEMIAAELRISVADVKCYTTPHRESSPSKSQEVAVA